MGKLRNYLRDLFSPTPPHTAEEKERMAEARPATPQEIAEAKAKHGWKTNLPGSA